MQNANQPAEMYMLIYIMQIATLQHVDANLQTCRCLLENAQHANGVFTSKIQLFIYLYPVIK